jgi:phosphoribosylaminoimidazolecarboxamide formyltransferase/IMP cyclohydrolase
MVKVFAHTAAYDAAIAMKLSSVDAQGGPIAGPPGVLGFVAHRRGSLRYGENPHQSAGWYAPEHPEIAWLASAEVLQGKELSYNNLLDLHAAAACLREFSESAAVVVKHNTPCGVATSRTSLTEAYRAARAADEVSAFGGIVALNGTVNGPAAALLAETFLEAIIAPAFEPAAREILAAKKNLRLLTLPVLERTVPRPAVPFGELRGLGDSVLFQDADTLSDDPAQFKVVSKRAPSDAEMQALRFGWGVVRHVRSNAIVFSAADRTLGIGGGQTSRVEAVDLAARKAGAGKLAGSAVASDAFFPFRDGLDAAARAGATAVIQPGGSVRDAEVIAAADEHGMAMVFTGKRHFRH